LNILDGADADLNTLSLPASTTISTFGASLVDDADASAARTTLGVDPAGTDNSTDVTLAGSLDYLTIAGQVITRNAIDLAADVSGILPVANGGTGASTASGARTNLNVDVAGTDNSTDVTLVTTSHDYLSIAGQAITLGTIDISDDTNLVGGTGIDLTGDTLSIDSTVATLTGTQTLTNKTLASPIFTGDIDFDDASTPVLKITDTTNTVSTIIKSDDSFGNIGTVSNHHLKIKRNDVDVMTFFAGYAAINNDGNDYDFRIIDSGGANLFSTDALNSRVGILDSTPSYTLDVNGTGRFTGAVQLDDNLTITGDLTVNGTTTTVNQTNLDVSDNIIGLNRGVSTNANDSGLIIERGTTGDNVFIGWDESLDRIRFATTTADASTTGDLSLTNTNIQAGRFYGDVTGNVTGNADTATALATGRTISLTGDVTGTSGSFDGTGNVSIAATIAANSVALGTDTTGNYMSDLTEGTGIDITHTPAEGSNATIALDLTEVGVSGSANQLLTDDGDGTVTSEANLTFDGSTLNVTGTSRVTGNAGLFQLVGTDHSYIQYYPDGISAGRKAYVGFGSPGNDIFTIANESSDQDIYIFVNDGGSMITALQIDASSNGKVKLPNDSQYLTIGAGEDLRFQHNGTNSFIENYTGALFMNNTVSDSDIYFGVNDGGVSITALRIDASDNGRVRVPNDNQRLSIGAGNDLNLYNNGSVSYISNSNDYFTIDQNAAAGMQLRNLSSDQDITFSVNDGGSQFTAVQIDSSNVGSLALPNDNQNFYMGASNDFRIIHNGTDTYLNNYTGDYIIGNFAADKMISFRADDGTGLSNTEYFRLDGNTVRVEANSTFRWKDSARAQFGASSDLQIYHDATDSYITNGTGNLYIRNDADDKAIHIQTDDGAGGVTDYMKFSGNENLIRVYKNFRLHDSVQLQLGTGNDMYMYHNGTDSWIRNNTGHLYIRNDSDGSDIYFGTNDDLGTLNYTMAIDGTNNRVGIGTTSPSYLLHLSGTAPELAFTDTDGTATWRARAVTNNFHITETGAGDPFVIQSGAGANAVVLSSSGNVGIGASSNINDKLYIFSNSTADLLGVVGVGTTGSTNFANINFRNLYSSATGDSAIIGCDTGSTTDKGELVFSTSNGSMNATEKMRITSGGNVIMQSGNKLYLDGGVDTYIHENIDDSVYTTVGGVDLMRWYETAGNAYVYCFDNVRLGVGSGIDFTIKHNGTNTELTNTTGDMRFIEADAGNINFRNVSGTSHLYIKSGGNVGIGTTSPSANLHIGDANAQTIIKVAGNRAMFGYDTSNYAIVQGGSTKGIRFNTNSDTFAGSPKMTITTAGNVGIGVTSPASALHVVAAGLANHIRVSNTETDATTKYGAYLGSHYTNSEEPVTGMLITSGSATATGSLVNIGGGISSANAVNIIKFYTAATNTTLVGTERMKIDNLGDVKIEESLGIGVAASSTTGRLDCSNDVVAYSTSDKRLKENIKPLDSALDKVLKINGVEFDWKELTEEEKETIHGNKGHDVGVIAQEIEEVLPEVVTTRDTGYKAVKYEKIVPLLIEAIKEQQQQINELKEKLNG